MPPQLAPRKEEPVPVQNAQNFISLDDARVLANEAAKNAANEILSKLPSGTSNSSLPLSPMSVVDKKGLVVSVDQYEDMKKRALTSGGGGIGMGGLGERFEQALNQKITDDVIGGMVGKMFGSDGGKSIKGGIINDILNSTMAQSFGLGLGQNLGSNIKELVSVFGQKRVNDIINAATNAQNPQQENGNIIDAESSPVDDKQKSEKQKVDDILITLDSTNPAHVNEFMKATGINNFANAQRTILSEQDRIRKERNISTESRPREQSKEPFREQGIRREPESFREQSFGKESESSKGDFFNSSGSPQPFSQQPSTQQPSSQINEEEFMRSINPDDPISQQQYMMYKGYSTNIPLEDIKRMILRDKKKYENKNIMEEVLPNTLIKETTETKPVIETEQTETKPPEVNPDNPILLMLQQIQNNLDGNMKSINQKMEVLEKEITVLKSTKKIEPSKQESEFEKQVNNTYKEKEKIKSEKQEQEKTQPEVVIPEVVINPKIKEKELKVNEHIEIEHDIDVRETKILEENNQILDELIEDNKQPEEISSEEVKSEIPTIIHEKKKFTIKQRDKHINENE